MNDDINKISEVLAQKFAKIEPVDFGWEYPSLNVLDCVLSLNRKYKSFTLPRINRFARNHPEIRSLDQLKEMINCYVSPVRFSQVVLDYNDEARANTLLGVVDYFINIENKYQGTTENERLHNWAINARPEDAYQVGVKGFGIAGFQYLRMLFGAQTTKPDKHITRFISNILGRPVKQEEAVYLLEEAALKVNLPVRDVDHEIWKELSSY
jgi:hypothetical protein